MTTVVVAFSFEMPERALRGYSTSALDSFAWIGFILMYLLAVILPWHQVGY